MIGGGVFVFASKALIYRHFNILLRIFKRHKLWTLTFNGSAALLPHINNHRRLETPTTTIPPKKSWTEAQPMGYIHVYYTVTLHTKAKRKPGLLILTAF